MLEKHDDHCELCGSPSGELVWEDAPCRVVSIAEADDPGFSRVILNSSQPWMPRHSLRETTK